MKPLPKLLAAGAVLAAVSLTAGACDASPYAATVNSHVIKQAALDSELQAFGSNHAYRSSAGLDGQAPGTYSTKWVSGILTGMIVDSALRERLAAAGTLPSPAVLAASRSVDQIGWGDAWFAFSPGFRDTLVSQFADEAMITSPNTIDTPTLLGVYSQYKKYFFTRVCTVEASSRTRAAAAAAVSAGLADGTRVCYTQRQFEAQPKAFQSAVESLPVGRIASPVPTPYGYRLVKVVSRTVQGLTAAVKRTLAVALLDFNGRPNPALDRVVASARVKVNPQYGTWSSSSGVTPPTGPAGS